MRIISIEEIQEILPRLDLLKAIRMAFISYSTSEAAVGPVGELLLEKPPGEVHIKYGFIKSHNYYVVKVASGFSDNPSLGLPSSNGLMLLFDKQTGALVAVLLDEGYLTDVRTAVAGAVVAQEFAPKEINRIGIIGSGVQARLQLRYLADLTGCCRALVWGRTTERIEQYRKDMKDEGIDVELANSPSEVASICRLIVMTTSSREPLLDVSEVQEGTHITAVGSDSPFKQELDARILGRADLVVADSILQCLERGEISHAIRAGLISKDNLIELGSVIVGSSPGRSSVEEITVADLTGVAVQDIAITEAVYQMLASS